MTDANVIADALARIVRAREAIEDGESYFAASILGELEADLAGQIESEAS